MVTIVDGEDPPRCHKKVKNHQLIHLRNCSHGRRSNERSRSKSLRQHSSNEMELALEFMLKVEAIDMSATQLEEDRKMIMESLKKMMTVTDRLNKATERMDNAYKKLSDFHCLVDFSDDDGQEEDEDQDIESLDSPLCSTPVERAPVHEEVESQQSSALDLSSSSKTPCFDKKLVDIEQRIRAQDMLDDLKAIISEERDEIEMCRAKQSSSPVDQAPVYEEVESRQSSALDLSSFSKTSRFDKILEDSKQKIHADDLLEKLKTLVAEEKDALEKCRAEEALVDFIESIERKIQTIDPEDQMSIPMHILNTEMADMYKAFLEHNRTEASMESASQADVETGSLISCDSESQEVPQLELSTVSEIQPSMEQAASHNHIYQELASVEEPQVSLSYEPQAVPAPPVQSAPAPPASMVPGADVPQNNEGPNSQPSDPMVPPRPTPRFLSPFLQMGFNTGFGPGPQIHMGPGSRPFIRPFMGPMGPYQMPMGPDPRMGPRPQNQQGPWEPYGYYPPPNMYNL